jgi:hypothetical protein
MIERISNNAPASRPSAPEQAAAPTFSLDQAAAGRIPARPPAEVLQSLARAQSVLAELASREVSMHITVDAETAKVRVELRNAHDEVIREVPPRDAVAMLAGERSLGLGIDEKI